MAARDRDAVAIPAHRSRCHGRCPPHRPDPFRAEDVNLMSDFADHAAEAPELGSALERARHLTVLVERERIAHELNYRVIRGIFAVSLDLQATIARSRSSEITARLNRSVTDLQTAIENIRTTVFELHATGTQRIDFRQQVQAAVADLTENRDIATTLRMSGPMSVISDDLADHAESVTEYGVQTLNSDTVVIVTADRDEAEHALEWIQGGRVVHRTITYGGWLWEDDENGTAGLTQAG
jgi:signal transduction histidine kinase